MNIRADQKQQTRRRIVDAARQAIREQGLEAPSVQGVMADAGLTVGGFYAHFANRDALMLEALADLMNERIAELRALVPTNTPVERRALTARYYLSRKHRDGAIERCPLPAVLSELAGASTPFREQLETHLREWADLLRDRDDSDGRAKALAAIATMVGALTIARALGATSFSDEVLRAAKAAVL
jgi:TetR/AcrR family transcriptional repressor of nem operon